MDETPQRKGQIEYLREGFILHWDADGLGIEVIDYHATVLRLDWKDVQALATIASGGKTKKAARPRSKRSDPPEI